ncbi:MAG: hypothetical protein LIP08_06420 [Bacteroides sp.]|nr:hypothetical protein [Bacteroides sp.]
MKILCEKLDQSPTPQEVQDTAELRIRNLLAFKELRAFNDTGDWLYQHPLISEYSELEQLRDLRRKDPAEFLKQHANCTRNIQRYQSYLKNPGRKDKEANDKANLDKHRKRLLLFKTILESEQ